jgi:GT2 family glycosyltransferase
MKASVIIATYRRNDSLENTIRSVLLQDYPDFELLVVDQSDNHTPEAEKFLRTLDDPRYSYFLIAPPSLPAARNFGLARSSGEIVIYIDDDVLLDPDFIRAHVKAHGETERLAAVGGRVRTTGEAASTHLFAFSSDGTWSGGYDFPEPADIETARGCNMSFRRSALEKIGGFDPSYEKNALREETDVCFRLRRRGYQIRFDPLASIEHLILTDGGCRDADLWGNSYIYQNETLFHVKNMGLRLFILFFFRTLTNRVLPHKRSRYFWTRLRVFCAGIIRGIWLAFFPKKLKPKVVWQSNQKQPSKSSFHQQP